MIKKLAEKLSISNSEAAFILQAYDDGYIRFIHVGDVSVEELIHQLLQEEMEDEGVIAKTFLEKLEDSGITSKRMYLHNGYPTIILSKGLKKILKSLVLKHTMEVVVDVVSYAYKKQVTKNAKTLTLLRFLKDEEGSGFNFYLNILNDE